MQGAPEPVAWLWPGTRLRIARVLVDADSPLAGSEVAQVLGVHTSNVNRELVAMEQAGLVTVQPPDPADPSPPGRPSRYWRLDAQQRQVAEDVLATSPTPQRPGGRTRSSPTPAAKQEGRSNSNPSSRQGAEPAESALALVRVDRGQELVIVDVAESQVVDLMTVLAESQQRIRLTWTALCGDELLMALDGPDAPSGALDLMTMLKAGGSGRLRRVTVSRVWPGNEFLAQARASTRGHHGASGTAAGDP